MANQIRSESDGDLLSLFYRNHDSNAIDEFVNRNREKALKYAMSFVDQDAAEDIVQLSILRLMNARPVNDQVTNAMAWWRAIIHSVAIDQIRSESSRSEREIEAFELFRLMHSESDAAEEASRAQLVEIVRDEVAKLDDQFRLPLIHRHFRGRSYGEIGEALHLTTGTVSTRLARGLSHLKSALTMRGIAATPDLSSTQIQSNTGAPMVQERHDVNESNRRFAKTWRDLWAVSHYGLGRFTSRLHTDGKVSVTYREDWPLGESKKLPTEYPEHAEHRAWSEQELLVTDVMEFSWSHLKDTSGTVQDENKSIDRDYVFTFVGCHLSVKSSNGEENVLKLEGDGPVIMNPLLPLLISQRTRKTNDVFPVRFLGCYQKEAPQANEIGWAVIPVNGQYMGPIGKPMKSGHLFTFGNESASMEISMLAKESGQPAGFYWEEEGYYIADDEATARAMFVATRS